MTIETMVRNLAQQAKEASWLMTSATTAAKNQALIISAVRLLECEQDLLAANAKDLEAAHQKNYAPALLDRLTLTPKIIAAMAAGLRTIAALPDPVGDISNFTTQPSGIRVGKMRVPLGVVAIIYEARPNVTADAAALCLKSGNACLLRGGSEAINSNLAIMQCLKEGLIEAGLPKQAVCFIDQTDRAAVSVLLRAEDLIDVVIPRGGKGLVKRISDEARVPVIKHLDGICHVYVDVAADFNKAHDIAINAKTSRYGTCNTMETLLVHQAIAAAFLPDLIAALKKAGVTVRGCAQTLTLVKNIEAASEEDWHTEYLAPILSIKVVQDVNEAITHINHYGSHHTDSIISEHIGTVNQFVRRVDSASVMVNASTRFADGAEYGLGAEIGISTNKLHARGPVGLEGLTSQKWLVWGDGHIRT